MSGAFTYVIDRASDTIVEQGAALRFVERDGRRILQQLARITPNGSANPTFEWRDVPLADEAAK